MKVFLVLAVYLTAVFAAPTDIQFAPPGSIWTFRSSIFEDFEESMRKMRDEFDQLEKSLESRFKFPNSNSEETGVRLFQNGTSIFNIDPSKVKNESFSDTKIVDDKVVHTEEKVIANDNSVIHIKKVEITPKGGVTPSTDEQTNKTYKTPVPSPVPEVTSTKNDVDSEQVDNDHKPNRSKDVEEIDLSNEPLELRVPSSAARKSEWDDSVAEIPENDLSESDSNVHPSTIVDLSNDTKVNDILSENIASGSLIQPEPDAEIVEINSNNINNRPNYDTPQNPANRPENNRYYYNYSIEP